MKRVDYREIFQEYYNRYLNEINNILAKKNDFSTYCLPKEEFIGSCFYDGMHFNLKGLNKISELAGGQGMSTRKMSDVKGNPRPGTLINWTDYKIPANNADNSGIKVPQINETHVLNYFFKTPNCLIF